MEYPKSDYNDYPKTVARDDFWAQVRRTQYGKRITEDEVEAIVAAVRQGLALRDSDVVLDLACGNGALSTRFFDECAGWLGVDASEYLIEIAQEFFGRPPRYAFQVGDVCEYVSAETEPGRFTRGLCYGSFSYFSPPACRELLRTLQERFPRLERLLIGNIPDKTRASLFYPEGKDYSVEISDHTAQIGVWWSQDELRSLAAECAWSIEFSRMPAHVFNTKYRYDAVLTRGTSEGMG